MTSFDITFMKKVEQEEKVENISQEQDSVTVTEFKKILQPLEDKVHLFSQLLAVDGKELLLLFGGFCEFWSGIMKLGHWFGKWKKDDHWALQGKKLDYTNLVCWGFSDVVYNIYELRKNISVFKQYLNPSKEDVLQITELIQLIGRKVYTKIY